MSERVLIVDDDEMVRKVLTKVMESNGLETATAESGDKALSLILGNPDAYQVILLDIMLGECDGFSVLKQIRAKGISTPLIIISAKNEDYDKLYGLGIGADDYVSKPFNPIVLGAKVKALIRRSNLSPSHQSPIITLGPFTINPQTFHFFKNQEEVFLSSKEFALMQLFITHPHQVFSKEDLYNQIWGNIVVDDNTIMVYINRLRIKIEDNPKAPKYLTTVWGVGYTFSV